MLEQDLDGPVGYVLPLARSSTGGAPMWQSGLWLLRGKHLFLVPGDSPAGLRLPLDALAWVDPRHAVPVIEQDPLEPRPPLPARDILPRRGIRRSAPVPAPQDRTPATGKSADWVVRTALVVQPRDGRLHVFFPPLAKADDYVDLLARVEDTAAELETPVVIEGYPPPSDPRLSVLKVTPDPGVIEVNTHPAGTWEELVSTTTTLIRRGARDPARDGDVPGGWTAQRHRGRQPRGAGGTERGRLAVSAPSRSAAQPGGLLDQSSVPVVSVLGTVHRTDESGAAGRRDPSGQHGRDRDRVRADRRERPRLPSVAGRPRLPASAGRRHREHPSRRVLHRQALCPRNRLGAAGGWSSCGRSKCRPIRE